MSYTCPQCKTMMLFDEDMIFRNAADRATQEIVKMGKEITRLQERLRLAEAVVEAARVVFPTSYFGREPLYDALKTYDQLKAKSL